MNEPASQQRAMLTQPPSLATAMSRVTKNAIFFEARQPAIAGATHSSDSLYTLVAEHIPAESRMYSLIPVAPGGRFENLDRSLLVWSSLSDRTCQSLPTDVSEKMVNAIREATANDACGYSVRGMRKIEREMVVRRLKELVGNNAAELAEIPLHQVISEVIRAVFGQPMKQGGSDGTSEDVGSGISNTTQLLEAAVGGDGENDDGLEIMADNTESMIESWRIARKNKVLLPVVKLVAPPAGHPTTSILRPVATSNPRPEDDDEAKSFSPLDYTTNIGDASVVHKIYLEARNTGIPRTEEQELARRRRATRMAFKEMKAVADETKWHQEGRGYQDGPQPSVLEGIENVPKEEKRKWLLEKRAAAIKRRSECRLTILDNNEASDHIFVLFHALRVCRQAGAEGIIF